MSGLLKPTRTFCDIPFAADLSGLAADAVILGAPHGSPYKPGTPSHAANGAKAVREALSWYSAKTDHLDFDSAAGGANGGALGPVFGGARLVDAGDVAGDLNDGAANRQRIKAATSAILAKGAVPILLGGDDSVPIPYFAAYEGKGPVTIVQVDAHIDWREELEGERFGFSSTMRRASEMTWVERIVQVGARGPGSARATDFADAKRAGVTFFTGRDVHEKGMPPVLDAVPAGSDVILTIDVDGLDPALVPGVILPAFGGVTYQQMLDLIWGLAKKARIAGATFVEFVPERDPTGYGAQAIARLASNIVAAIGKNRSR